MNFHLITLGCPKNLADSQKLVDTLSRSQIDFVDNINQAETVVINTCSFILEAREEAIDTILEVAQLKKKKRIKHIFVVGCLPQKYLHELEQEIPEIDGFFDQKDFTQVAQQLTQKLNLSTNGQSHWFNITPAHYAYLKIAEGCNNRCLYCTIPSIKGDFKSRSLESLLEESQNLISRGIKELIVVAQDTTFYGRDENGVGLLYSLLKKISGLKGLYWLRLLYTHPAHLDDNVIELINTVPQFCKYIDIPLQHIANPVLKRMGRNVTSEQQKKLIDKIRTKIPELAIRTTFMVGFPGETDRDFQELVKFVEDTRFERLGAFKYSQEDGTPAADLPNQVSESEKEDRLQEIMELQRTISFKQNSELIGKKIEVLIDSFQDEEKAFVARSQWDAPLIDNRVLIEEVVPVGQFVNVKIIDADEYDLKGVVEG
jgi:ribosomal protein S12 methylthiotransferase